ncbi:unnamed protein product [Urochloa humidicola]
MATADAPDNPAAAGYYSGPPLNPNVQPQPAVGERANAPPAPQQQQNAGEQANHTQVVGIPGYYNNRLNNANTAPSDRSLQVNTPAPAPASDQNHATVETIEELSWIRKFLMCFANGK